MARPSRSTPVSVLGPSAIAATIKGVIEADKRQGFRGPLLNLKKKDWDDFTKKEQAFLEGEGKRDEVIAAFEREDTESMATRSLKVSIAFIFRFDRRLIE